MINTDNFVSNKSWDISGGITGGFFEWDGAHLPTGAAFRNQSTGMPGLIRPLYGWLLSFQSSFKTSSVENAYPLVNIQKAIENGHRNSGFSHK